MKGKIIVVKLLVCGIVFIAVCVQFVHIKEPLLNAHYFRQTQTATVARNFYRYGIDLLHPRLDVFGVGEKEILVLEFPFFQGIVAGIYRIFGEHDYMGRMTAILWGVVAAYFLYKSIVHLTENPFWALVSITFFLFSPLNIFFNQAFMVESSVVALQMISVYLWLRLFKRYTRLLFGITVLVTTLAFVAKIIYAPILLVMIATSWIILEGPFAILVTSA